ncbi:MAG: NADH-quinone oxidoreductase subunit C [Bacillota bacterium]|nr:NADH-quinone oxidoreductase subunit C [Bacillota bacterium]
MNLEAFLTEVKSRFPGASFEQAGQDWVLRVPAAEWEAVAGYLAGHGPRFDYLSSLTAVDRGDRLELVLHLRALAAGERLTVKTDLNREQPEVASVTGIWKTANWHEREVYDLFGVVFRGHPKLRRILLAEDFEGHPLRKDYVDPRRRKVEGQA